MNDRKTAIEKELADLHKKLESKITEYQNIKEELENFLSQFTCVLDAPSCGCSEEELNDPKFDALYTEQDRLTKLSKTLSKEVNVIKANITALEEELNTIK
jgi:chromosome segregation ATPase